MPRGVVVDEPFHALSALTDNGSDLGHTLVVLEEGAEATMLTETASFGEGDGGFHCGGIELIVGDRLRICASATRRTTPPTSISRWEALSPSSVPVT